MSAPDRDGAVEERAAGAPPATATAVESAPVGDDAAAELRHELRTPLNLVVGYCEMLLEDADGPALAPRREALEAAIGAVRDALARIADALPPARANISRRQIATLADSLRAPQERIVGAMNRMRAAPDVAADPALVDDVEKVTRAAQGLAAAFTPYITAVPPPATVAEHADPGRATILVVDDVGDNRTLLDRRLRRDGYAVICAASGRHALEMMSTRPVDLVLLDVMMPEMDGVAVLECMKADPLLREIPVVMISALDDVKRVAGCLERGADDYLPKPFNPVLLRARVGALLERKRLRDQELAYLREVDALVCAAGAIEEGTYVDGTLAPIAARTDRLGRLARVLDTMAVRVRSREDRLHAQIRQLEAEIALVAGESDSGRPVWMPSADAQSSDPHDPLTVGGDFAGRYAVRQLLGRGGMGTVYLADDRELGEPVAIKTLRRDLVDENALARFKTEIRLARRISHRNVVRTHDFGVHDGVHYVTMEYVRGITLRELIDTRERLGVEAALAIGRQLARALAVAHDEGVIHRDVKPQNLLLDERGVLKVMDFGIARLVERTTTLTRVGMVIGTPAYMSPEQLLDEPLDARSDLYAAGVVLFEALTGRLPHPSSSAVVLISGILTVPPPSPALLNPEVPGPLADLVLRLLARSRDDRPASAGELAELLGALA